jgi:hypothetical protein
MPWFRDEYERLRQAGKIEEDNDPFADIRSDNDNDLRQGSQPGHDQIQGSEPDQTGSTTRSDRANNPVRQGYKPDEENRRKRTDRNEQTQTDSSASRRGPAGGSNVGGDAQHQQGANDNAKQADLSEDWRDQFWDAAPERKNVAATEKALIAIVKTGVSFESILIAVRRLKTAFYGDPVKWLADEPWRDNAKAAKAAAEQKKANRPLGMAI